MNVKEVCEFAVNMNNRTMLAASKRGAWSTVEQSMRISETMIRAYEKSIGAERT
jgi:hypothetical protein